MIGPPTSRAFRESSIALLAYSWPGLFVVFFLLLALGFSVASAENRTLLYEVKRLQERVNMLESRSGPVEPPRPDPEAP